MATFLAIIVPLVLITGSQANDSEEDLQPNITVDALLNHFSDNVKDLPYSIGMLSILIWDTKTGHALYDILVNVSNRYDDFQKETPPELFEILELAFMIPAGVLKKVSNTLRDLEHRKALTGPLKPLLSHYFDPLLARFTPKIVRAFRYAAGTWLEGFLSPIYERGLQDLKALDNEVFCYFKKLEDGEGSLQPLVNQALVHLRQSLEALHKNLKPRLKNFLEDSQKFKEELKKWVNTPIFPPDP